MSNTDRMSSEKETQNTRMNLVNWLFRCRCSKQLYFIVVVVSIVFVSSSFLVSFFFFAITTFFLDISTCYIQHETKINKSLKQNRTSEMHAIMLIRIRVCVPLLFAFFHRWPLSLCISILPCSHHKRGEYNSTNDLKPISLNESRGKRTSATR